MSEVSKKIQVITRQGGCLKQEPSQGVKFMYNMFLTNIPIENYDYYLSMKAFLITQDLKKTQLVVWADDKIWIWMSKSKFIQQHSAHIKIRFFNYSSEIRGTPLEKHKFFGSSGHVRDALGPSTFSDIVRNLILHNYGHIWLDNDAVLLRDILPVTNGIGYQFIPSLGGHTNGHVLFLYPHSKLSKRILENLVKFSMKYDIVKKQYIPDHWPIQPQTTLVSWVYNDALPLLTKRQQENRTEDEDKQFWYDAGWFDPLWLHCFPIGNNSFGITDMLYSSEFGKKMIVHFSENLYFILHTRYPRSKPKTFHASLMYYLIKRIDSFFSDFDGSGKYSLEPMNLF